MGNDIHALMCFICSIFVIVLDVFNLVALSSFDLRFGYAMFVLSSLYFVLTFHSKMKNKSRE